MRRKAEWLFYLKGESSIRPVRVDLTLCTGFFERLTGALVAGSIPFRRAYLFPGGNSIHTWFMRASISVLTFDESGRILDYRPSIPPFRWYVPHRPAVGLIELAPRRIDRASLSEEGVSVRFPAGIADEAGFESLKYQPPEEQ